MFNFFSTLIEYEDQQNIKDIFCKYYPLMKKTAASLVGNDLAEDIVMESMLCLIRYINTLKDLQESSLAPYITVVTRNTAYSYLKKRGRITEHELHLSPEDFDRLYNHLDTTQEKIEWNEAICLVMRSLKPRDQDLLYCRYFLQMSYKEIGKFSGIPENQVGVYLHLARKYALKILEKGGWEL